MARILVKNLKDYSIIVFSWNKDFLSISFEPQEIKDLTGIQINTTDNFNLFIKDYIRTNILTLIPIYDETIPL